MQQYDNGLEIAEWILDRGQKEGDMEMLKQGHMWSAINLVGIGQNEQAKAHMKEYLKLAPHRPFVNYLEWHWKGRFQNPDDLERILDAIHKAGMRRFK